MKTRAQKFREFCEMMREVFPEAKDYTPGAFISACVDAFKATHPLKPENPELQVYDDEAFRTPFVCYVIQNRVAGTRYVGIARNGFAARYPKCEWWKHHHNERLRDELEIFGRAAFRVYIYVCLNAKDAERQEAVLLRTWRGHVYNLRKSEADAR